MAGMGSRSHIFPAFAFVVTGCVLFAHLSAAGRAGAQAPESPELKLARQHYFSGRYTAAADVTGGMEAKVKEMLELVQENPGLKVQIFSGTGAGNLVRTLMGETLGTDISAH